MSKRTPMVGLRFGRLVVTAEDTASSSRSRWICLCDCGTSKSIRDCHLRSGATKSCGCGEAPPRADLTGRRVGRLTVMRPDADGPDGRSRWICRCDCGTEVSVRTGGLTSGRSQSCGCLMVDKAKARRGERRTATTSYRTAHKRVHSVRGMASAHSCVDCGNPAQEWSYDHADPAALVEVVKGFPMAYSENVGHYEPRCIPCHRGYDAPHA